MLVAVEIHKRFGDAVALGGVSLSIAPGELVGLVGPNGAGKSTLANIVSGVLAPDRGTAEVGGLSVAEHHAATARMTGYASQELAFYPARTVRDNLVHFGRLAGMARHDLAVRIDEVAGALELTALLDRRSSSMSGGEKRRLHTAIAVLHRPGLLLLDEPTAGADVESRERLIALVRSLVDEGSAVLYSTHYLAEVERLDANVVMLSEGRILASGPCADLVRRHGVTVVELDFAGVPPSFEVAGASVSSTSSIVRITSPTRTDVLPHVLAQLGSESSRLRSVQVAQPSLETVYLQLRGSAFGGREVSDVGA